VSSPNARSGRSCSAPLLCCYQPRSLHPTPRCCQGAGGCTRRSDHPDPSSCRAYRDRTLSSVLMTDRLRRVSQRCQKRTSVFVTRLREKRYSSRSSCRPPSSLWRAPHRVPCRASQHRSCGHRRMALGFATNEILGLITHDPLVNGSLGLLLIKS